MIGEPHTWDEPGSLFPRRALAERLAAIWLDENGDVAKLARALSDHARSHGCPPVPARRVWNWVKPTDNDRHAAPMWVISWLLRETRMRLVFDGITMRVVDAEDE